MATDNLKHMFGVRLQLIRRSRNLTQEALAEKIGRSVESISNLERGINAPSFNTLERLAKALNVSVKSLFDFEEK